MGNIRRSNGLLALPNEILLEIILPLRTPELLPLIPVCHRLHDLVVRIIRNRLIIAASLAGRSLVLECYPPSRKLYESHMLGNYLGTEGLEPNQTEVEHVSIPGEELRHFNGLYSRFQPYRRTLEKRVQWKHPAGDVPGSRTYRPITAINAIPTMMGATSFSSPLLDNAEGDEEEPQPLISPSPPILPLLSPSSNTPPPNNPLFEPVKTLIHLDAGDLFSQLCANVDISIPGPKPGIFHGFQKVSNNGVLRIWRHWLAARVAAGPETPPVALHADPSILWVNNKNHIGIRFRVQQKKWNRAVQPVLVGVNEDEDAPISYELVYEELLVRTRDLLLASEELRDQEFRESGKAIVIGTWI